MKYRLIAITSFLLLAVFSSLSFAATEVGLSHSYKKTLIDENNFSESQATTGTVSFYLWERSAIEFSYTHAVGIREEQIPGEANARSIRQTTQVIGLDIVFGFANRQALFQPYVKAGAAHIDKKLRIQQGTLIDATIAPDAELVPSAGLGTRIRLSEAFAFNISLDAWGTKISGEGPQLDTSFRAGITWML